MAAEMTDDPLADDVMIHPLSKDPTLAWESLKLSQKFLRVTASSLQLPSSPQTVRFVCISDTHSYHTKMKHPIPSGDVLIHAGDFTLFGDLFEVKKFNSFLGSLPHRHKIVVAGNHELRFADKPGRKEVAAKDLLTNCTYLQDSGTDVDGIRIYGTPWQPRYGYWAFNLDRGKACLEKWNLIPADTDVLISHGPPLGRGDFCVSGVRAGCSELLATVQKRVKPKYHVFGHIHEGHGVSSDGQTVFINASICNVNYSPANPPIVFDIPLPKGRTKDSTETSLLCCMSPRTQRTSQTDTF